MTISHTTKCTVPKTVLTRSRRTFQMFISFRDESEYSKVTHFVDVNVNWHTAFSESNIAVFRVKDQGRANGIEKFIS